MRTSGSAVDPYRLNQRAGSAPVPSVPRRGSPSLSVVVDGRANDALGCKGDSPIIAPPSTFPLKRSIVSPSKTKMSEIPGFIYRPVISSAFCGPHCPVPLTESPDSVSTKKSASGGTSFPGATLVQEPATLTGAVGAFVHPAYRAHKASRNAGRGGDIPMGRHGTSGQRCRGAPTTRASAMSLMTPYRIVPPETRHDG